MIEYDIPRSCGNAPKQLFVVNFRKAIVDQDIEYYEQSVSEDFSWLICGSRETGGKDFMPPLPNGTVTQVIFTNVLSHGREAALRGSITLDNGTVFDFADFYVFSSAKGQKILSASFFVTKQ